MGDRVIRVTVPLKAVMVDEKKRQLFSICSKLRIPDTQRLFSGKKDVLANSFQLKYDKTHGFCFKLSELQAHGYQVSVAKYSDKESYNLQYRYTLQN